MKYAKPEIELMELNVIDVIRTSSLGEGGGSDENGPGVDFGNAGGGN